MCWYVQTKANYLNEITAGNISAIFFSHDKPIIMKFKEPKAEVKC